MDVAQEAFDGPRSHIIVWPMDQLSRSLQLADGGYDLEKVMLRIDRDVMGWIRALKASTGVGIQETLRESIIIGLQQVTTNMRMLGRGSELPPPPPQLWPPDQHVVPTPHGEVATVSLLDAVQACERVFKAGMQPNQRELSELSPAGLSSVESDSSGNLLTVAAATGQSRDEVFAEAQQTARKAEWVRRATKHHIPHRSSNFWPP